MKERKKMINAKEVIRISQEAEAKNKAKAIEWVNDELYYLEKRILEAAKEGKYATEYWWDKNILKNAGLTQGDVKNALEEILSNFGYSTAYCFNYSNADGIVFKVYISWGAKEDE